jgi:anti-sigma B factor antagonist
LIKTCASVHKTSSHSGPTSWKVTEVSDLRGDRTLVLHGELDIATAPELIDLLARLRHHGHAVTVDLAEVTFMDSTGLTALMDARRQSESNGWAFSVRRPSPAVRRVFDLAGVTRLLGE